MFQTTITKLVFLSLSWKLAHPGCVMVMNTATSCLLTQSDATQVPVMEVFEDQVEFVSDSFQVMYSPRVITFPKFANYQGEQKKYISIQIRSPGLAQVEKLVSAIFGLGYVIYDFNLNNMSRASQQDIEKALGIAANFLFSLNIRSSFPSNTSEVLDLSQLSFPNMTDINIINSGIAIRYPLVLTNLSLFNCEKNTLANQERLVLVFGNKTEKYSGARLINLKYSDGKKFYPEIVQAAGVNGYKLYLKIFDDFMLNNNSNFLQKESTARAGYVKQLYFPKNLERIEFGTISNSTFIFIVQLGYCIDFGTTKCQIKASFDTQSKKDNWLAGNCTNTESLCEFCLMHQYGFHYEKDNIDEICAQTNSDALSLGQMKQCYWQPFSPLPAELENRSLVPPVLDKNALDGCFCPPDDVNFIPSSPIDADKICGYTSTTTATIQSELSTAGSSNSFFTTSIDKFIQSTITTIGSDETENTSQFLKV